MDFLNDLTLFCLGMGLPLGGLVLGRRLGPVSACWLALGALLGLRFADRLWRPVFTDMRHADPALNTAFWLPMSFLFLFLGLLGVIAAWAGLLRPASKEFTLPARSGEALAMVAGGLCGVLLTLALVQSQALQADAEQRLPRSLGIARPVLAALGQKHLAPGSLPATPASTPPAVQSPGNR